MAIVFVMLAVAVLLVLWAIFRSANTRRQNRGWGDGGAIFPMSQHHNQWLDPGAPASQSWFGESNAGGSAASEFSHVADTGSGWDANSGSDTGFSSDTGGGGSDFGGSSDFGGGGGDFGGGGSGGDFS